VAGAEPKITMAGQAELMIQGGAGEARKHHRAGDYQGRINGD